MSPYGAPLHNPLSLLKNPTLRGVLIGDDATYRLRWGVEADWELEELPPMLGVKGRSKTKLRTSHMRSYGLNYDALLSMKVLSRLTPEDLASYDSIQTAILRETRQIAVKEGLPEYTYRCWYEREVHHSQVPPANATPMLIRGKDFSLACKWTEFHAYSPGSDFRSMDPSYTVIEASSKAASRKLYKLLIADQTALESVSWEELRKWLDARKIRHATRFSSWH